MVSQVRLVGSHITNLGAVSHGALELYVFQFGGIIFLVTHACFNISSKKRCLQRHFTYDLKAHTISNMLVIKVSAQKKGKKVMTTTNMCSNFGGLCSSLPITIFDKFSQYEF